MLGGAVARLRDLCAPGLDMSATAHNLQNQNQPPQNTGAEVPVCALLVERGKLKESDLARAERIHAESPDGTLTALLARLGLVSERDLAEAWAETLHLPLVSAKDAPETPPGHADQSSLSLRFMKQHHVVPIGERDGALELAVADPG